MNGSLRIPNYRSGPWLPPGRVNPDTATKSNIEHGRLGRRQTKRSETVESGQCRLGQGMGVQIEADQRRGNRIVLRIRKLVDINGKDRDLVMVRLVAGRR